MCRLKCKTFLLFPSLPPSRFAQRGEERRSAQPILFPSSAAKGSFSVSISKEHLAPSPSHNRPRDNTRDIGTSWASSEREEPSGRLHLGAIFLDGPSPSCVAGNRRCRAISPHVLVSFAKRCNELQSGFTVACSVSSPPPARAERRPSRG